MYLICIILGTKRSTYINTLYSHINLMSQVLLSSVQFSRSVVSDSLRPHGLQHARPPCPSPTPRACSNSGDAIQPSHPLPSPSPPVFNLSQHQGLCNELVAIRWPKYWSFSFSISPSNEYSGLISFRMDWLDLLAVQGTLKSLLQHHSSKASIPSVLSFLYSSTLTSIHDYWKNQSFDQMDLC